MDTDFLDLVVQRLGLTPAQQQSIKAKFSAYAIEAAALMLGDRLTADERALVSRFLANPTQETQSLVQQLFASPERNKALVEAFLSILTDFLDNRKLFTLEQREAVLADLEHYFESKQALTE